MESSGGINIQQAAGPSPAAVQRTARAGRSAWQRQGGFSFDLPPASMAAHLGLKQFCPAPFAHVPGGGTGKRLSGCAPHAVPAAGRGGQHMGCSALGLFIPRILPIERLAVAFRNSSYAPRHCTGGGFSSSALSS